MTSLFGYRVNPIDGSEELHNGIDIAASVGERALAIYDGTIVETGENALSGKYLRYETTNGYSVTYAHLSKIYVKTGDKIKKASVIALTGNTGKSSGPHLHYSLRKSGELLDPINFVDLPLTEEVKKEYALYDSGVSFK